MNILFTTSAAPEKSPVFTSEKRPPLGLGSLISVTRNEGHKVFFIDNYLKPSNFIEEYIDDIGLVYLPGYDIKAKFFYGRDSKSLVDYEFKQRTDFDKKLLKDIYKRELKKKMTNLTVSILPDSVVNVLRRMRKHD